MVRERNPKKDAFEMIGEFCREAAVLVLVFATLDKVISPKGLNVRNLSYVIGASFVFLVVGMAFESWRKT